jgi:D-alanyl-D-alanine carboxypeptidase
MDDGRLFKKISGIFIFFIAFTLSTVTTAKNSLRYELQSILDNSISNSLTPGAVLLVSSPKTGVITVAAGLANIKKKIPMEITNNFRIASMSKTFLAVTVLRLIEQGEFNLNDKMADLLPDSVDVDRIPNGNEVTVKQLLQMRSGIPNYIDYDAYSELIDKMAGKEWTPDLCIHIVYDKKLTFAPGSSYEYSNTNYLLLQLIVENYDGGSYADSIRNEILEPLKLKHTFVETQESDDEHQLTTRGYSVEDKKLLDVTDYNDGWGMGDGGMISTAEDMNIFVRALLIDKTLLKPASLRNMLSFKDEYGLGIWPEDINDETAWSHNGLTSGFQGQYYYFPDSQLTVILLTNNFDTDILTDTVSKTHKLITGDGE